MELCVGKNIILIITAICGDTVKLGWEAPDDVEIDREEVRESKEREGNRRPRLARA